MSPHAESRACDAPWPGEHMRDDTPTCCLNLGHNGAHEALDYKPDTFWVALTLTFLKWEDPS